MGRRFGIELARTAGAAQRDTTGRADAVTPDAAIRERVVARTTGVASSVVPSGRQSKSESDGGCLRQEWISPFRDAARARRMARAEVAATCPRPALPSPWLKRCVTCW